MWIYAQEVHEVWNGNVVHTYLIREVIGDTVMNNSRKYSILREYDGYWKEGLLFYERVDSGTGLVYRYSEDSTQSNDEYLIENLLSEIGDIITSYRLWNYPESGPFHFIHSTNNFFNDFGLIRERKVYSDLGYSQIVHHSLTRDIGLDSIVIDLLDIYTSFVDIRGCVINGVVYGDTTVVSVDDNIPNLPTEFSLSQNYPNPFNPATRIKYALSSRQFVSLKVYDVLGNEIATLVNEEKPAGSYEVEFSAIGGFASGGDVYSLSSGVYFYRLRAGSYSATKKMLYLK